jgi:hypothetical protein
LVLALTFGLLLSLIHCAGDGLAFAHTSAATVTTDSSGLPDLPDQQLPVHSGHCLSHVTAQPAAVIALPADLPLPAPGLAREEPPASLAGLPLFKPPRT